MSFAPILVFAYNRGEHLRQTLTELAKCPEASGSKLFIFCDGPKDKNNTKLVEKVAHVRNVARDSTWREKFVAVSVVESPHNKGLAKSIINGVTEILVEHNSVIVLEDDLLVSPDFLTFMNESLTFYADVNEVGSISAFSSLDRLPEDYHLDVYKIQRNCSTGWATWKDRWETIRWDDSPLLTVWNDRKLRRKLNQNGSDRTSRIKRQLDGKIDSWSIRFGVWQLLTDRYTIYASDNRVFNIGLDGSGVHSGQNDTINMSYLKSPKPFSLVNPPLNSQVEKYVANKYSGRTLNKIARYIKTEWLRL